MLGRDPPETLDLPASRGDKGELIGAVEYLRCPRPNTDGCDKLTSKVCLVISVMESVKTVVALLLRALLPCIEDDETLFLSELKAMPENGRLAAPTTPP